MAWIYKKPKKQNKAFNTKKRQEVYNTSLWRRMRLAYLRDNPLCEICLMEGRTILGEHVHHVRSFMDADTIEERDQLAFDSNNLLTVCHECHNRLHNGDLKGLKTKQAIQERIEQLKDKTNECIKPI